METIWAHTKGIDLILKSLNPLTQQFKDLNIFLRLGYPSF
jgi:hypothetical protein